MPFMVRDSAASGAEEQIWFVLNARAAQDAELREAVAELRKRGFRVEVWPLWEPHQASRVAHIAVENGATRLLVAGGDGTLHEVAHDRSAATVWPKPNSSAHWPPRRSRRSTSEWRSPMVRRRACFSTR